MKNGKKRNPFQEVQKPLGCLSQGVRGKHYPSAVLELLFVGGQLVLVTWPPPQTIKGLLENTHTDLWKKMNWRCESVSLRAASFFRKFCRQVQPSVCGIFPLIEQNCQSIKSFPANHFPQRKKLKLRTWESKTQC